MPKEYLLGAITVAQNALQDLVRPGSGQWLGRDLDQLRHLGNATEAVAEVIGALFDEAHLHRIVAGIDPGNLASRRVLEKLGFRYEGRSQRSVFVRGEWVDDKRFALLADDYRRSATTDPDRG